MQLQDQKAVSRNDPEHGRFLRLALSKARTRVANGWTRSGYLSSRTPLPVFEDTPSPMRLRLPCSPVAAASTFRMASLLPSSNQRSGAGTASGAGGSGTPPGPPLKVSGETAGCCPTPGRVQSHTPSGKAICIRSHCAGVKVIDG